MTPQLPRHCGDEPVGCSGWGWLFSIFKLLSSLCEMVQARDLKCVPLCVGKGR